jgi:hypothetical protein
MFEQYYFFCQIAKAVCFKFPFCKKKKKDSFIKFLILKKFPPD